MYEIPEGETEPVIAAIENGHVTSREVGDKMLAPGGGEENRFGYLTKTEDGKILKSSTVYFRGEDGKTKAVLEIHYDISALILTEAAVKDLIAPDIADNPEQKKIVHVSDLLDDLIERSVALVGKPVALMNKEDKMRAIGFLSRSGAFLITKSGEKIARFFGISKYTLYSYIDKQEEKNHGQD